EGDLPFEALESGLELIETPSSIGNVVANAVDLPSNPFTSLHWRGFEIDHANPLLQFGHVERDLLRQEVGLTHTSTRTDCIYLPRATTVGVLGQRRKAPRKPHFDGLLYLLD